MEVPTINEQPKKAKKKKVPQAFKATSPEKAKQLLDVVLKSDNLTDRRLALAGIIASVTDTRVSSPKRQTADILLKTLFVESEQFTSSFSQFLNKATNGTVSQEKKDEELETANDTYQEYLETLTNEQREDIADSKPPRKGSIEITPEEKELFENFRKVL